MAVLTNEQARLLLELQRATLLMYASCAWARTRWTCWPRRGAIRR